MPTAAVMEREAARVIQLETEAFRENFNKRWFPLEHALANHPLFDQAVQIEEWMIRQRVLQREPSLIEIFAEGLGFKLDNTSCFAFHYGGSWHSDMYLGRL